MCNLFKVTMAVPESQVLLDMESGVTYCRDGNGQFTPTSPDRAILADTVFSTCDDLESAIRQMVSSAPCASRIVMGSEDSYKCYKKPMTVYGLN